MMKVSDPIIFGHVVVTFLAPIFEKYAAIFTELGINPNHGIKNLYDKLEKLPQNEKSVIEQDIASVLANRPVLAMVNSEKGITNLHVPSDTIIDASMPAMIRNSGQMWKEKPKTQRQ
jgi:isocitrate dehydrogenase